VLISLDLLAAHSLSSFFVCAEVVLGRLQLVDELAALRHRIKMEVKEKLVSPKTCTLPCRSSGFDAHVLLFLVLCHVLHSPQTIIRDENIQLDADKERGRNLFTGLIVTAPKVLSCPLAMSLNRLFATGWMEELVQFGQRYR
jgi:hypothetical protein